MRLGCKAGAWEDEMIYRWISSFGVLLIVLTCTVLSPAQTSISATEATNHVGERATVCGEVKSVHYAARSRGNPTFINLDKAYPDQIFTVLIWGSDRPKFGDPEEKYRNKHICVAGKISDYKGVPEIVAYDPSQINVR
jgi:micrococcal nuclease